MNLSQLSVVVTGAAGGIGQYLVSQLLRCGASVAAGDNNAANLRALRREVGETTHLFVAKLDVTDEVSVSRFVVDANDTLDGLNCLIHCAGIARDGLLVHRTEAGVHKMGLAQWRRVLDVNLTGAFLMTREIAAIMLERRQEGCFVHLSSLCRKGNPGQANYAASKAGLDAATRSWALELAEYGIRVAAIAPGVTQTSFLDTISPERLQQLTSSVPAGRLGTTAEIWSAVRFILENDFFNGRVLELDGGGFIC